MSDKYVWTSEGTTKTFTSEPYYKLYDNGKVIWEGKTHPVAELFKRLEAIEKRLEQHD